MQDENIFKMSEMADTEIRDVSTLNILICYLLNKFERPINCEYMYEIFISTGIVNYFSYQEAVGYLLDNEHVRIETSENGEQFFALTIKGEACARELKKHLSKSHRDIIVSAALRYFARHKMEKEIKIRYTPTDNGCYIHMRCVDGKIDLMELKLFAPDLIQAKIIGDKIMRNPPSLYSRIIDFVLMNKEDSYDLSDN
ncbi:MAG: DUF4364 family protein [Ruminococcus sp.]|nr:DUF4364 family protein [Ruminococcus sp.]MDE6784598.1 DUF4364 family protein [Ruminococcus sp.]